MTTLSNEIILRLAKEAGFTSKPFYPEILIAKRMNPEQLMNAVEKLIKFAMDKEREEICTMLEASQPPEGHIWDVVDKIRNRGEST